MPDRSKVITQTKRSAPPGWGLDVRQTTSTRKKVHVQETSKMPQMGLINRRRSGYKEKDLIFGKRKVRILFKTRALISLLYELKQYRKTETKWEDAVQRDALQILGIWGWRRRAGDREEWRSILRVARAHKGL
jgi:hypothetical protein